MKTPYLAIWPDNSISIVQANSWVQLFQALDIDASPFDIKALWDITDVQNTRTCRDSGGLVVNQDDEEDFPEGPREISRAHLRVQFRRAFGRMYRKA